LIPVLNGYFCHDLKSKVMISYLRKRCHLMLY
jgi:hypothetical protein